ncbi:MAG: DUF2461 domain-containing protein [Acidobacteria bacterium]|nr:DUF2461 domain-containing protein [Acidobacteriota bacterium]
MPTATRTPLFKPRTLSFLRALKRNNDRAWFTEHKEEYLRDVHQPMLDFVAWVASELPAFAPELEASPRTSLFRIYRDTRFSADKTPFKTQVGAIFPQRGLHRNVSACLYVEIGPAGAMIFGGIYRPERSELLAIREHIARTHRRLRALLEAPAFKRTVGAMEGDALQRVPPGYAPGHPAAEYLKFRQFLLGKEYPAAFATSPEFPAEILRLFRRMAPVVAYLNEPLLAAERARDPLAERSSRREPKRVSRLIG